MADDGAPAAACASARSTSDQDLNLSTLAVVTCGANSSPLADVTFDARHVASAHQAFFKLRVSVLLKANAPTKTHLFIFIHPERIQSLDLDRVGPSPDIARRKLGRDTVCLRFTLVKPADLVGPKGVDLTPKNKAAGEVVDSLRCFARHETLSIHIPQKALSQARLLSLCSAISRGSCKPIARQADLASLYRGKGGQIVPSLASPKDDVVEEAAPTPSSPPSYDELGPSPPLAPLDAPTAVISKKRRRGSSSVDVASGRLCDVSDVEQACRKFFEMQKAEMLQAIEAQQEKLYSRLLADIKPLIDQKVADMENRIMDIVDERLGKESEEINDHLESRLEEVVDDMDAVIKSRVSDVDEKVEDEFYGLRNRLENFVEDEVADAEERIIQHIETSASISLTFNQ